MKKVIIYGASGHGKVVADCFLTAGSHEIIGFIDDGPTHGEKFYGFPVLGGFEALDRFFSGKPSELELFIAIGDNWIRKQVVERVQVKYPEMLFASAIHPSSIIAQGVQIGKGVLIAAGAVVNSDTRIGDFTILNTKASIDHDCDLHPYCSIAPGVVTGGNVAIGRLSALSIGAIAKHGISIGENVVLGAGAVLLKDLSDHVTAYGIPAKEVAKRELGQKYL